MTRADMRWSPRVLGIALMACVMCVACNDTRRGADAVRGAEPPNLLLVTLDTVRADHLGAYGHAPAHTPQLDALAARGVIFEQAFTPAPMTLPAHATLLTGLEPREHGARVNGVHRLAGGVPTLAEHLRAQGYRTGAFIGAFVLDSTFGLDRGFDVYDDDLSDAYDQEIAEALSVYRAGDHVVDAALTWLGDGAAGGEGEPAPPTATPFFAWIHLYDAHYPWHAHDELAGTPLEGVESYDAEIAFTDLQVGRLLAFLDERGLAEHTVVVAVADHGEGLGDHREIEHAYLLNEEVLRVPWIVAGPGVGAGLRVEALVSLRDFVPTALAVLGLEAAPAPSGRSLALALRGEAIESQSSHAETELPWTSYRWSPQQSLTTERWKYVRTPQPELYDRADDRAELVNLASARPDVRATLEGELAAFEAGLKERAAEVAEIDAEQREQLASLGYVVSVAAPSPSDGPLADVKERLDTKELAARLRRGQASGTLGAAEVLEMARELVRQSPETPGFHGQLGAALVETGELEGGIASLREAVRLDSGSASALYALGDVLERRGQRAEARALFERALGLEPDFAPAHVGMGNVLLAEGRAAVAAGHYTEALRLRPGYPEAYYNLGQTFLERRRPRRAIAQFEAALEQRPKWALAHLALAEVLRQQGRPADAVVHYEAALQVAPANADAENDLGVALAAAGRSPEARAHYEAALRLRADFFRPHVNLGNWYSAETSWAEALAHYEAAHALAPELVETRISLARFLATCPEAEFRDGPRAVVLAEAALEPLADPSPDLLETVAAAYAAADRFDEAGRVARRAATLAAQQQRAGFAAKLEERAAQYESPQSRASAPPSSQR
jgi:arylsulfatase A-like enzyme/Flp pilus assembly protein TadD